MVRSRALTILPLGYSRLESIMYTYTFTSTDYDIDDINTFVLKLYAHTFFSNGHCFVQFPQVYEYYIQGQCINKNQCSFNIILLSLIAYDNGMAEFSVPSEH